MGITEFQTVVAAVADPDQDPDRLLAALALVAGIRADIDAAERSLIEAARERKVGWARISAALGLASRQAAEQRLLRLSAGSGRDAIEARSTRSSQRSIDKLYGQDIARLRQAVRAAARVIAAHSGWDEAHPRARLVRQTLDLAGSAAPGGLVHLSGQALDDLTAMSTVGLPPSVAAAVEHLRLTWERSTPKI